MKTILQKATLSTLISVLILSSSMAQGPGRAKAQYSNNGNQGKARIHQAIPDLTEEQKASLKELRTKHYQTMKDFRLEMGEIQAKQRTIMAANTIDQKAAGKLIDEKTALMNKQMKDQIAQKASMKEVLTDEQLLVLEQRMGKRKMGQKMRQQGQRQGHNQGQGRQGYGPNRPGRNSR